MFNPNTLSQPDSVALFVGPCLRSLVFRCCNPPCPFRTAHFHSRPSTSPNRLICPHIDEFNLPLLKRIRIRRRPKVGTYIYEVLYSTPSARMRLTMRLAAAAPTEETIGSMQSDIDNASAVGIHPTSGPAQSKSRQRMRPMRCGESSATCSSQFMLDYMHTVYFYSLSSQNPWLRYFPGYRSRAIEACRSLTKGSIANDTRRSIR